MRRPHLALSSAVAALVFAGRAAGAALLRQAAISTSRSPRSRSPAGSRPRDPAGDYDDRPSPVPRRLLPARPPERPHPPTAATAGSTALSRSAGGRSSSSRRAPTTTTPTPSTSTGEPAATGRPYIARELPRYDRRPFRTIRPARAVRSSASRPAATAPRRRPAPPTFSVIESWSGYFHPTDPTGTKPLDRGPQANAPPARPARREAAGRSSRSTWAGVTSVQSREHRARPGVAAAKLPHSSSSTGAHTRVGLARRTRGRGSRSRSTTSLDHTS